MWYNVSMSKSTIVLKATRVTTMFVKDGDSRRLAISAFRPESSSIVALKHVERLNTPFILDINDETGEFTAGVTWKIETLLVADDTKALTALLLKA